MDNNNTYFLSFLHEYTYGTSSSLIRANARTRSFAWGRCLVGKSSAKRGGGKTRCWGGNAKLCMEMQQRSRLQSKILD